VIPAPRRVRRLSFTSGHSLPGVKGGQHRTGAELERDAKTIGWAVAVCAAVPLVAWLGKCTIVATSFFYHSLSVSLSL
jgi:hypothetical protein